MDIFEHMFKSMNEEETNIPLETLEKFKEMLLNLAKEEQTGNNNSGANLLADMLVGQIEAQIKRQGKGVKRQETLNQMKVGDKVVSGKYGKYSWVTWNPVEGTITSIEGSLIKIKGTDAKGEEINTDTYSIWLSPTKIPGVWLNRQAAWGPHKNKYIKGKWVS